MARTEYFRTEYEALQRARQLLEDGDRRVDNRIAIEPGFGPGVEATWGAAPCCV